MVSLITDTNVTFSSHFCFYKNINNGECFSKPLAHRATSSLPATVTKTFLLSRADFHPTTHFILRTAEKQDPPTEHDLCFFLSLSLFPFLSCFFTLSFLHLCSLCSLLLQFALFPYSLRFCFITQRQLRYSSNKEVSSWTQSFLHHVAADQVL